MQARILIVDDEADIRNSVTRGLQAQDFDFETAVDRMDGLAAIERWRPGVVLMDLLFGSACRKSRKRPKNGPLRVWQVGDLQNPA